MDFTGFTTPKTERGTPARGTLVATDQSTPAQSGAYGSSDQLIGTEARKAKQAQRREAREAKRRTLLASTPLPASSKSAAGQQLQRKQPRLKCSRNLKRFDQLLR